MSVQENKMVTLRVYEELFSQGKLDIVEELITPDSVGHDPTAPDFRGYEELKQFVAGYRTAFPDLQITVDELVAEGDTVVARWTARGTHSGPLMAFLPPSGKQMTITGMNVYHFSNGKIKEGWANWDTMGMMQQLGVVPSQV